MKDHSKITKIYFWMIQRAKRRFLAISWILVCWINLILHILIVLNVFQPFTIALIYKKGVSWLGNRSLMIMIGIVIPTRAKNDSFGQWSYCAWCTGWTCWQGEREWRYCWYRWDRMTCCRCWHGVRCWRWATGPEARLQFSTSVEVRLRIVSSLVSYSPVFPENRAQDFSDFLHECSLL